MNYRTLNDLNTLILNNLYKIPKNIDLIIGVPRSGLLVANLLALYLNKRISTPELFSNNIILSNGISRPIDNNEIKTVLVVDDSCNTGNSFSKTRITLSNNLNIDYLDVTEFNTLVGMGVSAKINGKTIYGLNYKSANNLIKISAIFCFFSDDNNFI